MWEYTKGYSVKAERFNCAILQERLSYIVNQYTTIPMTTTQIFFSIKCGLFKHSLWLKMWYRDGFFWEAFSSKGSALKFTEVALHCGKIYYNFVHCTVSTMKTFTDICNVALWSNEPQCSTFLCTVQVCNYSAWCE